MHSCLHPARPAPLPRSFTPHLYPARPAAWARPRPGARSLNPLRQNLPRPRPVPAPGGRLLAARAALRGASATDAAETRTRPRLGRRGRRPAHGASPVLCSEAFLWYQNRILQHGRSALQVDAPWVRAQPVNRARTAATQICDSGDARPRGDLRRHPPRRRRGRRRPAGSRGRSAAAAGSRAPRRRARPMPARWDRRGRGR